MKADFTCYQSPHGDPSEGALGLPYMRPDPACRTFNSSSVEVSITQTGKAGDVVAHNAIESDIGHEAANQGPGFGAPIREYVPECKCFSCVGHTGSILTGFSSADAR